MGVRTTEDPAGYFYVFPLAQALSSIHSVRQHGLLSWWMPFYGSSLWEMTKVLEMTFKLNRPQQERRTNISEEPGKFESGVKRVKRGKFGLVESCTTYGDTSLDNECRVPLRAMRTSLPLHIHWEEFSGQSHWKSFINFTKRQRWREERVVSSLQESSGDHV